MSPSIETRALTRRFGRTTAVRDLDLVVPAGCVFALMGPNGAGKSTTIKLLLNLLEPTSGEARVLGTGSRHLQAADFARIGYVSEEQEFPDWMSVESLVAYLRPFYSTWDDTFCDRLIRQFALPGDRPVASLSRGMRIKARMVAALSFRPRLLVLDEPFGGLDPLVRDEIIDGMLDLAQEDGWTILVSSHDMNELERLADRVGFLDKGSLLFSEETASLLDRHREVAVTLDAAPAGHPDPPLPGAWLDATRSERAIRFVDSAFDETGTPARVRALFPRSGEISAVPMSLRSIFVAHARSLRAEVSS